MTPGDTEITAARTAAEQAITRLDPQVRALLPGLGGLLLRTLGLPFGAFLLLVVGGSVLLTQFLPPLAVTLPLLLGLGALLFGLRWSEGRYGGISLFVLFTASSRDRRILSAMIAASQTETRSPELMQQQTAQYSAAASAFISAMQARGHTPREP